MAAVANVAINLDSRGVPAKLKQIHQASSNLDRSFKGLKGSAGQVKSAIQAQQGGFAKASTVQGVFSARVLNTEKAIRAQIAALREVQSTVKFNGALYQKAAQQIKQYEDVLRSSNKEEERSIGIRQRASKALSGLRGTLLSIGAGAAISTSFGDAQALALAQKRLARLTEEYDQFAGAQQEAERLANKFEVSVTDTSGALSNLGSRLGAQGVTLEEIVAVYEGMNSALIATGRSASEASSASYQLAQALGSGSLTGDELKTISETLPELLNAVAAAAGKSSTEIRAMAKEGALSADLIIEATKTLRDKYEGDVAANITQTQKFNNALGGLSEAIGTELAPSITVLLEGATEMLKLFGQLPGPVKTLAAAALGLTAAFVALAPAISAVTGLLGISGLAGAMAALPWVAVAAGVAALGVAFYNLSGESMGLTDVLQDSKNAMKDLAAAADLTYQAVKPLADGIGYLVEQGGGIPGMAQAAINSLIPFGRQLTSLLGLAEQFMNVMGLTNQIQMQRAKEGLNAGMESGDIPIYNSRTGKYEWDSAPKQPKTPTVPTIPTVPTGGGAAARGTGAAAAKDAQRAADAAAREAEQRRINLRNQDQLIERLRAQVVLQNSFTDGDRIMNQLLLDQLEIRQDIENRMEGASDAMKQLLIQEADLRSRLAMDKAAEPFVRAGMNMGEALAEGIGKAKEETDLLNQALAGAGDIIGNQLRSAIDGLIDGTADWNNILRDTLSQLGSFFLNLGLNQLAGPAGSGGILSFLGFGTRANGGPVNANEPYIVGERGPELFVPFQRGEVVSNGELRSGGASSAMMFRETGSAQLPFTRNAESISQATQTAQAMQAAGPINVKYESTVINGVEYVTREQAERIGAQSAERGRALTLQALQNSPRTRSKVGI